MEELSQTCVNIADEVGEVTGAVYGAGALVATGSLPMAATVGAVISSTVEDGWENGICQLPAAFSDSFPANYSVDSGAD